MGRHFYDHSTLSRSEGRFSAPNHVCLTLRFWVSLQIKVLVNEKFYDVLEAPGNGLKSLTYCHTRDLGGCFNTGLNSAPMS